MALARAAAARQAGADVLVLDEPTAALDIRAETALYENFLALTQGCTTVLVSHRCSSVRHADRIAVIAGGRVAELGTHEELVAAGGRYARMFALQAAAYAEDAVAAPAVEVGLPAAAVEVSGAPVAVVRQSEVPPEPGRRRKFTVVGSVRELGVLVARSYPLGLLVAAVETLGYLGLSFNGYALRPLVDAALRGDHRGAYLAVTGFTLAVAVGIAVAGLAGMMRLTTGEQLAHAVGLRLATVLSRLPGVAHHEDPLIADQVSLVLAQQGQLGQVLQVLLFCGAMVVVGAVALAILGSVDPWLLLLTFSVLPPLLLAGRRQRLQAAAEDERAPWQRCRAALLALPRDPAASVELRLFGQGEDLLSLADRAWERGHQISLRLQRRLAVYRAVDDLASVVGLAGAVILMTLRAAAGHASVGDVVLTIVLARTALDSLLHVLTMGVQLGSRLRALDRLRWLEQYAETEAATWAGREPAPDRLTRGIRLEGVAFRYPNGPEVLTDITVELPASGVVAVVGENGAGKTTLVKLLTGLYRPTRGRILLDKVDLADIDVTAYRSRVAGAFQDHAHLELTAGLGVRLGDIARLDVPEVLDRALARADARSVVDALPAGADTQLGTSWPGGVELSGGQWQRLSLARGLARVAPLLLVLDEPTASLDAETEHALVQRMRAAAADQRATGSITVLVSHRFSTVRGADLIVVLDQGRIVEAGTHEQLVARGGGYAELYQLQAAGYR